MNQALITPRELTLPAPPMNSRTRNLEKSEVHRSGRNVSSARLHVTGFARNPMQLENESVVGLADQSSGELRHLVGQLCRQGHVQNSTEAEDIGGRSARSP